MAQAALRIVDDEIDTGLVRRLMARPLRAVPDVAAPPEAPASAPVAIATTVTAAAGEVSRLKAEVMVMKAVLGAERREAERLRACISRIDGAEPLSAEAQAVRDRWAALVDHLLNEPR
ncbi:hypothetical protein ASG51_20955 [Methylobacterium sp. Leaf465]|uniref:hypothetical protein n=1 Tax=Methylobacterium sp. Leaf465 TaxID=1736385 RepID=UPI0007016B49|nr:hypothetical protein [Methylobacterium sp. Leaf465]KQT81135.1 hypothetical protein ASG51_20955 [Methylobacterium sp. Leaf465]